MPVDQTTRKVSRYIKMVFFLYLHPKMLLFLEITLHGTSCVLVCVTLSMCVCVCVCVCVRKARGCVCAHVCVKPLGY